jgi:hypothetical protein
MEHLEVWKTHPVFDLYQGSTEGRVRFLKTGKVLSPMILDSGYYNVSVRGATTKQRKILVHRFIYSCFNEDFSLDSDLQIDHLNDNPLDNGLANLDPKTRQENNRKAQKNRDMEKIRSGKAMNILAENTETGERRLFRSKYQCSRFFGKSPAMVYFALNKLNLIRHILQNGVRWEIREPTQEELEALPFSTLESVRSA